MFLVLASEVFFTRVAERELLQQDARGHVADAAAIEAAYEDGRGALDAMDDALDLVESMEDRHGIDSATLLNAAGAAISAPRDTDLGPDLPRKPDRNTVAPSAADVKTSELEDGYRFLVPVHIRGEQFWLRVDADGTVLRTRISALSDEALVFSIASMVIGIGLFYVLAGLRACREEVRSSSQTRGVARDTRFADRPRQSRRVPERARLLLRRRGPERGRRRHGRPGNAGLEMLREFPVDFVKIDKAIIAAAPSDTNAQAVLFAIIAYARGAGAYVIAEGIETEEMLSFVREPERFLDNVDDSSIKGGQGYLLGLPSADISGLTTSLQVKTHWLAGRRQVHTANSVARASRQAPPKARL